MVVYYKRRGKFVRPPKSKSMKSVPKNTKKYVKKQINRNKELKQLGILSKAATQNEIVAQDTWEAYAGTSTNSLTSIGQGDDDFSRDADRVVLSHIDVGLEINFPSMNPVVADYEESLPARVFRAIFVQLKKHATVAQILTVLNTTLTAGSITPLRGNDKLEKFCHILKEINVTEIPKTSTVSDTAGARAIIASQTINKHFRLRPKISRLEWLTATTSASIPDVQGGVVGFFYTVETDSGGVTPAITDAQSAHYRYNAVTRFREL